MLRENCNLTCYGNRGLQTNFKYRLRKRVVKWGRWGMLITSAARRCTTRSRRRYWPAARRLQTGSYGAELLPKNTLPPQGGRLPNVRLKAYNSRTKSTQKW